MDAGTWVLGDLTVNRIGFGAMRLPQRGAAFDARAVPRDREEAVAVLRQAVELGVNHIDTAAFYFSRLRSANELINRALAPYPSDLVIATKVGPRRGSDGRWLAPATPEELRGDVEENLRQLGRDHLDLVNLRVSGPGPLADHFGALAELRAAGLIRHLGLSSVRAERVAEAQAIAPVICVQNPYGLGFRPDQDEFVRVLGEQAIAYVPFFTIAGAGREAGLDPAHAAGVDGVTQPGVTEAGATAADGAGEVAAVARAHGATPAQVRLAWMLSRGRHVLVIPGTGDSDHLADNVNAGTLHLTDDDLARLDIIHRGVA